MLKEICWNTCMIRKDFVPLPAEIKTKKYDTDYIKQTRKFQYTQISMAHQESNSPVR